MNSFYVNIGLCGSVSAGKSTLINAIMGDIVSHSGMGRTTSQVIKFNYANSKSKNIIYNDNLTINIYDTPGNSDHELGINTRTKSFLTLANCHIIVNVIDFLEAAKPTSKSLSNILDMLSRVNRKARSDGIYQNIIHVVNKGDEHSSEYKLIYNKIKNTIPPFDTIIKINASWAALINYKGDALEKEQLLRIINSVSNPPVVNTELVTFTAIQTMITDIREPGYELLIKTISDMLENETHLMCMSNCTSKYLISTKTIVDSLVYYSDLKEICELAKKPYISSYNKYLYDSRNCSECNIL